MAMKDCLCLVALGAACLPLQAGAQSLYSEASFRPLLSDHRARLAGDVLTVIVAETSSASTSADLTTQRKTDLSGSLQLPHRDLNAGVALHSNFDGGGVVQRSDKVLAQLSVLIERVDPNGDLWVGGEQDIEINGDKQHIKLEGLVRTIDIAPDNTVQSNRLANAKISYVGDGALADQQKPGWLSKVFSWLGL